MIILEGEPPSAPTIIVGLIQPDGTIRHVSFLAERLSVQSVQELVTAVEELLREPTL